MSFYRVRSGSQEEHVGRLILAGVLVTALPSLPLGNFLLYPFTILTTWFHEMGHGLTALLLGMDFERLVITANGSGVAETSARSEPGALTRALVAAGGPLGPSVIGSLLIMASSRRELWKPALLLLAAALAISTLIWVRSLTGLVVLPLVAVGLATVAMRARDSVMLFSVQFLGVLAALSMFRDWDYLFSESGTIGGQAMVSDTGVIEQALVLPHWIWAILIILVSGSMIVASLKYALNREG